MSDSFPDTRPITVGSRFAIIAPAGPFDRELFDAGVAWLRTRYEVSFDESIYSRTGFHAGGDDRRCAEIEVALLNSDVDAILCARGGYGVTRLLPRLSPEIVAASGKPVVGFSDITALHALWARAGVRSYHAEMVANLGQAEDGFREAWIAALEGTGGAMAHSVATISPGVARGRLTGGNLAVLVALLGTPYEPPLDGTILFLEDVGERPYRVDRMLTQLTHAGWFSRCAGVALGAFTDGAPGPDGVAVEEVLQNCLAGLGIPVVSGIPAGHVSENETLAFGSLVEIGGGSFRSVG